MGVVTRWSQCRQHSKMNCCHAFLRYFLIISNLVIGLLGLLILSGGLWLHFGEESFEETVEGIKNQTSISSEEFKKVDETLETLQQHDNLNYFLLWRQAGVCLPSNPLLIPHHHSHCP